MKRIGIFATFVLVLFVFVRIDNVHGQAGSLNAYNNNGVALPTTAITAGACTAVTGSPFTATGITTASHVNFGWASDPSAVAGYGSSGGLVVRVAPGSGTVIAQVCNPNTSSITGGAQSINIWVGP